MPDIPDARVTRDAIYIDGQRLPGWIKEGGVVIKPGGTRDINTLTVTFLVGAVDIESG